MKLLVAVLVALLPIFGRSDQPDCPAFGEWKPWTDQCLWYPLQNMHEKVEHACGIETHRNMSIMPTPAGFHLPDRCGHCSFKVRCRTRPAKDGCFPAETESKVCHEFKDVCTLTPHPKFGCHWQVYKEAIRQCNARADIKEWQRKGYEKLLETLPDGHCVKKGNECKCCCGGYYPNLDGTQCYKMREPECTPWGQRTEWSQCLWFPLSKMATDLEKYCDVDYKTPTYLTQVPTPAGFHIPEKCGFCSFSVRCQKREKKDGCFPLRIEKRSCGKDEHCPTCGDVCTLKKQNGSCEWTNEMLMGMWKKFESKAKELNMPTWRREGYADILKYLPKAKCKAVGDECKCCCHPYHPNEDGTKCVPQEYCKSPKELQHEHKHEH